MLYRDKQATNEGWILDSRFTRGLARRRRILDALNWAIFPFFVFAAALVVAFYLDDLFIINVWYIRAYFYAFFSAQIWLLAQFYLYVSMRPPRLDYGDRFSDRMDDNALTVIVLCYNEPMNVLERTLRETRRLFSGKIILADDSTINKGAIRSLALKYKVAHYFRGSRRGYKAGAINDSIAHVKTAYVALLDCDAVPTKKFFDIGLSYARRYELVQFPQFYENRGKNTVTRGAYAQQIPFMYRIMPLRSSRNSAFMLGTNLIFKTDAIRKLGGFDEESVTEDLSTSVKFHEEGFSSIYIVRNTVNNSAPESLRSYFIQQKRWSQGTSGVFKKFLTVQERKLSIFRYADYFIGSSWYMYGIVFPLLVLSVFIFSVWGISFIFINPVIYYILYLPFILTSFAIFYITIAETGHGLRDMFYNLSFNAICFPIYMKGLLKGFLGNNRGFVRTPKENEPSRGRYRAIMPQLALLTIVMTSMMVSGVDIVSGIERIPSVFNLIWASFYFALLAPIYIYPY